MNKDHVEASNSIEDVALVSCILGSLNLIKHNA